MFKQEDFVSYEVAKKFIQSKKINNSTEYHAKHNELTRKYKIKLPKNPDGAYKRRGDWINWKKFLGREYVSYKEVKEYAIKNKIKNAKHWYSLYNKRVLPRNYPYSLATIYKKEWKGWDDFLDRKTKDIVSYQVAKKFIQSKNLKSAKQYYRSFKKYDIDLPATPPTYYKEWTSWYEFLGKNYPTYEELKDYANKNNITTSLEWKKQKKEKKLPSNFPGNPSSKNSRYKKDWKGWHEFFDKRFVPFNECKKFAQSTGIMSFKGLPADKIWRYAHKKGWFPNCIPAAPEVVYKTKIQKWRKK